jgi:prolyl oligopeptidase
VRRSVPETAKRPVVERFHGREITDEYRWLEESSDDVSAWTDAQNAYTRAALDSAPSRPGVEARLRPLMEVGAVSAPAMRASRYFYARREGHENQPRILWREGYRGEDRLLVDPAQLDPSGLTTVEWISPSHDGRLLAYGTFSAGDENTTLRLMDVDSAKTLPLEIPNKTQTADWLPDGSGFVYHNLERPDDPYSGRVAFHRLGTEVASDVVLFRQFTSAEDTKLATTWGPFGNLSRDGKWLLLGYWIDTRSTDLWIVDFARFLRTGEIVRTMVTQGEPGLATGVVIDDVIYLQTTKGAPNGRVVAVPATAPARDSWRDVVPERSDAVIEAAAFPKAAIAVTYLRNASNIVEVFERNGDSRGPLAQPGIGAAVLTVAEERTEAYLTFTSFNYPTTVFRVDVATPESAPELWEQPSVPVDPSSVAVKQVWYPSKDGTRISMFLVGPPSLIASADGPPSHEASADKLPVPTYLTGYGGFNISETPIFNAPLFDWFERGGLYALPNLRGGGEYGDRWHEAGMLDKKQNTFDDFIAAAEWLIGHGYASPDTLVVAGGSNGGLLVGAAITQRPELFRAAIIAVPLLDMLRYQHFLMARYWVPEYGSAEDPAQFEYLTAYSPYHCVREGTRYPAVLLAAGEHDTRVHPMHARKMAARLQDATSSAPGNRPVLLWIDRDAGHGQGKPLDLRLRDAVDREIFFLEQLK